jgi:rare lipoprotein A (peptidoglycan hydrolase)
MNFFRLFWIGSWIGSFLFSMTLSRLSVRQSESLLTKVSSTVSSMFAFPNFTMADKSLAEATDDARSIASFRATSPLKHNWPKAATQSLGRFRPALQSSFHWQYQTFSRASQALNLLTRPDRAALCPELAAPGSSLEDQFQFSTLFFHPDPQLGKPQRFITQFFQLKQSLFLQSTHPDSTALVAIESVRVKQKQKQPSKQRAAFQVLVQNHVVAEFIAQNQADLMAQRVQHFLEAETSVDCLQPAVVDGVPAGISGKSILFAIDDQLSIALQQNSELIAIDWINKLRTALGADALTLAEAQTQMYGLLETSTRLEGTASWYGSYFHGRRTAAGETFNQNDFTAAHPSLPFDTFLKVTSLASGKTVIVRVNDRGPYVGKRSLDLSREAARSLGSEKVGVISYQAVIMKPDQPAMAVTSSAVHKQRDQTVATVAYELPNESSAGGFRGFNRTR